MGVRIAGLADIVPGTSYKPLPDSEFWQHTRSSAMAVGNLEVPLTARLNPQHHGIVLHAPKAFAFELPKVGVGVVSIANNHIAGHGPDGVHDTLAACAEAGVLTLGYGANRREASTPLFVDLPTGNGGAVKAAIVCATSVGPRDTFATADQPGVSGLRVVTRREEDPRASDNPGVIGKVITEADEDDVALLVEQVREAKRQAPIVIAVLHWGLGDLVLDYMKVTARRLIDAGAGVVFGHHSHRLAAVDWYNGAPIYYGLGSFLFQYDGDAPVHIPRDASTALVDFNPETGKVEEARLMIGRLDADGVPWPASPERVERVVEDVERLSAGYGLRFQLLPNGCVFGPA